MQNLKNQKERDMEDLAYKIAQQLQNNSDDIYQKYIESSKTTFESLRVDIQREINKNTANLSMLSDQNKKYDRAVTVLRYNNQNQDKKINFQRCDGCRACVSQYQRADFCVFVFLDLIRLWLKTNYEFDNT